MMSDSLKLKITFRIATQSCIPAQIALC